MPEMTLGRVIELSDQIARECETDAELIDQTLFDKRGVGETFGIILAKQMALARAIEGLARIVKAEL